MIGERGGSQELDPGRRRGPRGDPGGDLGRSLGGDGDVPTGRSATTAAGSRSGYCAEHSSSETGRGGEGERKRAKDGSVCLSKSRFYVAVHSGSFHLLRLPRWQQHATLFLALVAWPLGTLVSCVCVRVRQVCTWAYSYTCVCLRVSVCASVGVRFPVTLPSLVSSACCSVGDADFATWQSGSCASANRNTSVAWTRYCSPGSRSVGPVDRHPIYLVPALRALVSSNHHDAKARPTDPCLDSIVGLQALFLMCNARRPVCSNWDNRLYEYSYMYGILVTRLRRKPVLSQIDRAARVAIVRAGVRGVGIPPSIKLFSRPASSPSE